MIMKFSIYIKIPVMVLLGIIAISKACEPLIRKTPAGQWVSGATVITATESENGTKVRVSGKGKMGDVSTAVCGKQERFIIHTIIELIIDDGVTHIGEYAFSGCQTLASVIIPNSVTSIGKRAFYVSGLTSVTIPTNVSSIGKFAFLGVDSIEVAVNNTNYSSIDGVLFNKDKTMLIQYPYSRKGSYTIPDGMIAIGDHAFYMAEYLSSVTIPGSVTFIGTGAFYGCEMLVSISIPDGITEIKSSTFFACYNLTSVTIPSSVSFIGHSAFKHSDKMTSFTILNPIPPKVESGNDRIKEACLYVPPNSIEAYRDADFWKDFKCIKDLASAPKEERSQ